MIDSKIKPQPGEGRGINTINQKGPGLQKEEPDAGAALPDRASTGIAPAQAIPQPLVHRQHQG